jgi:uncharacterized protein (TIGR02145 family)
MNVLSRIFTPSKEITMKTTRRFLTAAISMALALTFLACGDGGGGGGGGYDDTDSSSSVVGGAGNSSSSSSQVVLLKCGEEEYDRATHYCKNGTTKTEYGMVSDGTQNYKTVVIGDQTWMAENLNVPHNEGNGSSWCYGEGIETYSDGKKLITLTDAQIQANCAKYGRLYDWAAAMDLPSEYNGINCSAYINDPSGRIIPEHCTEIGDEPHRGICPQGFHIPTNAEWNALLYFVDGGEGELLDDGIYISPTAGKHLKDREGWPFCGPEGSYKLNLCEDTFGFSALPGGERYLVSFFQSVGWYGYWRSATDNGYADSHTVRSMGWGENDVSTGYYGGNKSSGYSVRCVKD